MEHTLIELCSLIFLGLLLGCHYLAFRHPRRSRLGKALQRSGKVRMLGVCVVAPLSLFLSLSGRFPLLQLVLSQLLLFWLSSTALDALYLMGRLSHPVRRAAMLTVTAALLSLAGWNNPDYRDTFSALLVTLCLGVALLAVQSRLLAGSERISPAWQSLKTRLTAFGNLLVVLVCLYFLLRAFTVIPITSGQLHLVEGGFQLCLALMIIETLVWTLERSLRRNPNSAELADMASDTLRALLYSALGVVLASWITRQDLGKLMLSSAFFSLGLGLALKPTLGNFVSGLIMRLSRDFSLGDLVQIGNTRGVVRVINWRSVGLATLTHDLVLIPHSQVAKSMLVNHSRPTRQRALYIEFKLPLSQPPALARQRLEDIVRAIPEVLQDPPPEVYLMALEGWAQSYRIRCWIDEAMLEPQRAEAIQTQLHYGMERAGLATSVMVETWLGWLDDPGSIAQADP